MGCRYNSNTFNITCQQHQHIYILKSLLRRSYSLCFSNYKKTCCPSNTVCSMYGSLQRVQQLKNLCDGKQHCQVDVSRIECDYRSYTDNEIVDYFCIDNAAGKLELGIAILKYTIVYRPNQNMTESMWICMNACAHVHETAMGEGQGRSRRTRKM